MNQTFTHSQLFIASVRGRSVARGCRNGVYSSAVTAANSPQAKLFVIASRQCGSRLRTLSEEHHRESDVKGGLVMSIAKCDNLVFGESNHQANRTFVSQLQASCETLIGCVLLTAVVPATCFSLRCFRMFSRKAEDAWGAGFAHLEEGPFEDVEEVNLRRGQRSCRVVRRSVSTVSA